MFLGYDSANNPFVLWYIRDDQNIPDPVEQLKMRKIYG